MEAVLEPGTTFLMSGTGSSLQKITRSYLIDYNMKISAEVARMLAAREDAVIRAQRLYKALLDAHRENNTSIYLCAGEAGVFTNYDDWKHANPGETRAIRDFAQQLHIHDYKCAVTFVPAVDGGSSGGVRVEWKR